MDWRAKSHQWMSAFLAVMLLIGMLPNLVASPALAQTIFMEDNTRDVRALNSPSELPGQGVRVSFSVRGANVRDVLRAIGRQGRFNVMVDDSVDGMVSVDMTNVPIPQLLQTIATQNQLHYALRDNNTFLVFSGETINNQELRRTHTDIIPLKYANAAVLANILNSTVFAPQGSRQQAGSTNNSNMFGDGITTNNNQTFLAITPDFRTNSLIIVGTEQDILVARDYVTQLDLARSSRTWRLSHADVLDVASILSSSLFNEGTNPLMMGGSGSNGSGGGAGNQGGMGGIGQQPGQIPSLLRVREESIEEGAGADQAQTAGSGAASDGSGEITVRMTQKTDSTIQVSPMGPLIVPDTRLNTLTVMGTRIQLDLAENIIARLDQPAPQLTIEASLIEVNESALKELGADIAFKSGDFSASFDGLNSLFRFGTGTNTGIGNNFQINLNALIRDNRAKILANPTLITLHDKEAVISIVDEIIETVTVTIDSDSNAVIGQETNIGNVGITLNVLPRVGPNGSINMRIRPSLSTIASVREDAQGNIVTLLSRREAIGQQIKMRDGETFVLGGLIQETDSNSVSKYPILGDLPILGALARNSSRNRSRTELLIVLTPHIIKEDGHGPGILPPPVEPRVINAMAVSQPPPPTHPTYESPMVEPTPPPEAEAVVRGMWLGVEER